MTDPNKKSRKKGIKLYTAAPAYPGTVQAQPPGADLHACMGLNSCKGQDRYGRLGPDNQGPNDCAGQGFCSTATDHQCHVTNDCKNQGGCGLYGTDEEVSNPGRNECRSLGSCATPINAERFITTGKHRGESVWLRARAAFEEQAWPELKKQNSKLPDELPKIGGKAFVEKNGDIFKNGPAFLWMLDDEENTGIVSCGSSGMSGAGGCA